MHRATPLANKDLSDPKYQQHQGCGNPDTWKALSTMPSISKELKNDDDNNYYCYYNHHFHHHHHTAPCPCIQKETMAVDAGRI